MIFSKCCRYMCACFLFFCFPPSFSYAQQTWKWGKTCTTIEEAWMVAMDNAGNFYAAGIDNGGITSTIGGLTLPGDGTAQSVWVKYNSAGVPLWAGATYYGWALIDRIKTDADGNLFIYGTFSGDSVQIGSFVLHNSFFSTSGNQYFLAKISPSGTVLWAVKDGNVTSLDGDGALAVDDSGAVYVGGEYTGASMTIGSYTLINTMSTTQDLYIAKYSSSGSLIWAASAGGASDEYIDAMTVTPAGELYLTGFSFSPALAFGSVTVTNTFADKVAFLAEYSLPGTPVWAQLAQNGWGALGNGLANDTNGNIYWTGTFFDTSVFFGTDTLVRSIPSSPFISAAYLVKYTPTHAVAWARSISGAHNVAGTNATYSPCGKVCICGSGIGGAIVSGTDTITVPSLGDPIFIASYDLSGNINAFDQLASGGDDDIDIACDATGNLYMCGDFETSSLTVGPDVIPLSASEQFFVAKYGPTPDTATETLTAALCGADSSILTAPAGVYYLWDNGATTQTRIVGTTGDYWVIVNTSACSDSLYEDTFRVMVHGAIGSITGSDSLCIHGNYTYTDTTAGGSWSSSAPGVASIGSATGHLTTVSPGAFTITYTAPSGCIATKTVNLYDTYCESGVHPVSQGSPVQIFPNPSSGQLTILMPVGAYQVCTLVNSMGEVVLTRALSSPQTDLTISGLAPGVYTLRFKGDQEVFVEKVIKE